MNEVVLKEWRPGLKVVSLIELVHEHTSVSLPEAKNLVERFLAGERVTLSVPNSAVKAEFLRAAEALGVEGE